MNIKHISFLVICLAFLNLRGQDMKFSFSSGKAFNVPENNYMSFIGKNEKYIFYKSSYGDTDWLYLFDSLTLDLKHKLNPTLLGIEGDIRLSDIKEDKLYIFSLEKIYKNPERAASFRGYDDEPVKTTYTRAYVFAINEGGLSMVKKKDLAFFNGELEIFAWTNPQEKMFRVESDKLRRLYDLDLNEHSYPASGEVRAPFPEQRKFLFRMRNIFDSDKEPERQKFFYLVTTQNFGGRLYAKAEFVPDVFSEVNKGHIDQLQLSLYDSLENTKKAELDLQIRNTSYILDYEFHTMPDKRILLFGIYQDKTAQEENLRLGWFSCIIEPGMNQGSPFQYYEMVNAPKDKLKEQEGYGKLMSPYSFEYYFAIQVQDENTYILRHEKSGRDDNRFGMILIDKKVGTISYKSIGNKYSSDYAGITGYLDYVMADTVVFILFNDHILNNGLAALDKPSQQCTGEAGKTCMSYVVFNPETGFTKRLQPYTYDGNYIVDVNLGTNVNKLNKTGDREILAMAYNADKTSCRICRIIITR